MHDRPMRSAYSASSKDHNDSTTVSVNQISQYLVTEALKTSAAGGTSLEALADFGASFRALPFEGQPKDLHLSYRRPHLRPRELRRPGTARPMSQSTGVVKRRITRACDQCHRFRTKCDGQTPCGHCKEVGLECKNLRESKKRGKASRKDIAEQRVAGTAAISSPPPNAQSLSTAPQSLGTTSVTAAGLAHLWADVHQSPTLQMDLEIRPQGRTFLYPATAGAAAVQQGLSPSQRHREQVQARNMDILAQLEPVNSYEQLSGHLNTRPQEQAVRGSPASSMHNYRFDLDKRNYSANPSPIQGSPMRAHESGFADTPRSLSTASTASVFDERETPYLTAHNALQTTFSARSGDHPILGSRASSPTTGSSGWLSPHSPSLSHAGSFPVLGSQPALRYPVLEPVLLWLRNVLPVGLACDLLEHYFDNSSLHEASYYAPRFHGRVFRRHSVLHPTHPRACSPSLLVSMLCVAASTIRTPLLSSNQGTRERICQLLFSRAVALSQHASQRNHPSSSPGWDQGYYMAGPLSSDASIARQPPHDDRTLSTLDDVATCYHLASVSTSSDYGADSSRWWNAAFALAKVLRLGQEVASTEHTNRLSSSPGPASLSSKPRSHSDVEVSSRDSAAAHRARPAYQPITEEQREERRRMWWLLYLTDRHLALCVNRDPILQDIECLGLAQPVEESLWQSDRDYSAVSAGHSASADAAFLGPLRTGTTTSRSSGAHPDFPQPYDASRMHPSAQAHPGQLFGRSSYAGDTGTSAAP